MSTPLADIQRAFQDRLLSGSHDIDGALGDGGPFMKVYDHAYRARLVEVLTGDFEGVHTLLGDEQFADAMRDYVDAHPSHDRSIRWIGKHLPAWLAETEPWSNIPMLASMAAFEWMIGLAFDAPDAAIIGIDDVGRVPPEAWPMLTFTFHPALNTAVLSHDVQPFYQAVKAETDPDAAPEPFDAPRTWAAWRDPDEMIVRYRMLDVDEAAAVEKARAGITFDGICEAVADHTDADEAAVRVAGLMRSWIESGWIIGLDAEGMSW